MLTIAIPVFERTTFFNEALQSALNQTRPVEIIVVDNASSHDHFRKAVENCNTPLIKYYRNNENLGMYGNWNRCLELCGTDFVMILGDDDIIDPQYAEVFYEAVNKYPDIVSFYTDIERFGDREVSNGNSNMLHGYQKGIDILRLAVHKGLDFPSTAMAISKKLYPQYKFEYIKWAYSQDWLFTYTAFANGYSYGEKRKLIKYRVHKTGNAVIVGARAALSQVLVFEAIADRLAPEYKSEADIARLRERYILRNILISGNKNLVTEMVTDSLNPFGQRLAYLLKHDGLANLTYRCDGISHRVLRFVLRFNRKFFSSKID